MQRSGGTRDVGGNEAVKGARVGPQRAWKAIPRSLKIHLGAVL